MFGSNTQFYVRNGVLVCNRTDAVEPSVSSIPLEHGVCMSYRNVDSVWELGYSVGNGDFVRIADFESRGDARKALKRAQWNVKMFGFGRRFTGMMLGIILFFGLFIAFDIMTTVWKLNDRLVPSQQSPVGTPEGQAMSADDLLSLPN